MKESWRWAGHCLEFSLLCISQVEYTHGQIAMQFNALRHKMHPGHAYPPPPPCTKCFSSKHIFIPSLQHSYCEYTDKELWGGGAMSTFFLEIQRAVHYALQICVNFKIEITRLGQMFKMYLKCYFSTGLNFIVCKRPDNADNFSW